MNPEVQFSNQGQVRGNFHLKILIPSIAAGAIIGKGGETIAQIQKEVGARVKMSKANDFYPGTTERVCLISGSIEGIQHIHEFIMEKIRDKPDPNAKMAIDFDQKLPAEREKQVKILVPNSTAGMIIGKGGSYIKHVKENSGAYVQISQKSTDHALAERCITVIGEMDNNRLASQMIFSKIVEDPQSSSCLNISYADITGPVANFNPTGSPYANSGFFPMSAINSRPSYSSDGSSNSLSPTIAQNFQIPHGNAAPTGAQFPNNFGICDPAIPPHIAAQLIGTVKTLLRAHAYSESAVSEISNAMTILANYGLLGVGLNILHGMCGAPYIAKFGPAVPSPTLSNSQTPVETIGQNLNVSSIGREERETSECSESVASSAVASGIFGPIGSFGNGMSGLGLGSDYTSPNAQSHGSDSFYVQGEKATFESFRRASPVISSPNSASLPYNNNSFGLGTSMNDGSSNMSKSPIPNENQFVDHIRAAQIDLEIGENIVGAILGPGGKSLVEIQRFSGANIQISKKGIFAPGTRNRIVTIIGLPPSVATAQMLIERQIIEEEKKRAQQNALAIFH